MNITDEVYYYVETEALFSDPGSLGVRKLGTVASWTATLHRSQKEIACSFRVLLPCPGVQQVLFFDHRAFWMRTHMHACNPDIFLCARTHVWTHTHTHTHTHTCTRTRTRTLTLTRKYAYVHIFAMRCREVFWTHVCEACRYSCPCSGVHAGYQDRIISIDTVYSSDMICF